MDVKFFKNAYDTDLVKEVLQKGRITADSDGKVKMIHNLANNVTVAIELQVNDVKLSIKND